jgi:hypothetical protein
MGIAFEAKATSASNLTKVVVKTKSNVENEVFIALTSEWQSFAVAMPEPATEMIHPFMIFADGVEEQTISVRKVQFAK